ncbi:hypothetical protein AZI85_14195 [Bdellovibrio bacteriovorus]|uniref:Uncharacterized protein n=1 Tax=Bdellovibrio bacteriovorus TaxID=959 RepID=A0A150WUS4_BDEBC|nr:hypothetical protein [Bdellovibrio bacteriovorus]KYG70290.1 hypothetical protein AZI85_14195 [Bdellovibrio bacteriovorus]
MKHILLTLIFVLGSVAHAQQACSSKTSSTQDLKELCDVLNKNNKSHCDVKVKAEKQALPAISYGILSASSKMKGLFSQLEGLQKEFLKQSGGCPGGCSRISAPVVEVSTKPTGVVPHESCPQQYTAIQLSPAEGKKFGVAASGKAIRKAFANTADATTFAQETLMSDNSLGEYMEQKYCQSPCSYSSTIRLKSQESKQVDLELIVMCGPPKKERDWTTQASLTKSYRCEVQ